MNYLKKKMPLGMGGKLMLPLLPDGVREDLIRVAAEGAMGEMARDEEKFAELSAHGKGECYDALRVVCDAMEAVSVSDGKVREWCEENKHDEHLHAVIEELMEQRDWLLRPGFAWKAGYSRLKRYQRYFHGMEERIQRLQTQPLIRDEEKCDRFFPLWNEWHPRWQVSPESVRLWDLGWMLEEWRLELFAPGVPREGKVSLKKITLALEE